MNMALVQKQYFVDGIIYTITCTPDVHKRLRSDPEFTQQYIHNHISQLNSSSVVETNNDNIIKEDETIYNNDISNNIIKHEISQDNEDVLAVFKWPHEAILLLLEEFNLRQNDFTTWEKCLKKKYGP